MTLLMKSYISRFQKDRGTIITNLIFLTASLQLYTSVMRKNNLMGNVYFEFFRHNMPDKKTLQRKKRRERYEREKLEVCKTYTKNNFSGNIIQGSG